MVGVADHHLLHVRAIALTFPEVNERLSHGAPCFFIRDKRPLCYFHDDDFDAHRRASLMCPAPPGITDGLVASRPARFYRPATSASGALRDWLGMFLDAADGERVDWDEVAEAIEEAYRFVAPKRLLDRLDSR